MNKTKGQTVFIIDDDAAVRDSIQELVESVGLQARTFPSAQKFLDVFRTGWSGCLVLDVRMGGMGGMALQSKLNEQGVTIPVIFISGHGDISMAVRVLKAGALDFIQKPYQEQQLLDAINSTLAVDAAQREAISDSNLIDQQLASLTDREREVLEKVLEGGTSKQTARDMGISPRTVEAHRHSLLRKFNVGSVKDLILHPLLRK